MVGLLVKIAFRPNDATFSDISKVELQTRPPVPDNIQSWQVFDNDKDMTSILNSEDQFSGQEIYCVAYVEIVDGKDTIFGQEVVQFKTKKIPKGLFVLETIFDSQDKSRTNARENDPKDLE